MEVLQANPWSPHLVLANGYGRGRVWRLGMRSISTSPPAATA